MHQYVLYEGGLCGQLEPIVCRKFTLRKKSINQSMYIDRSRKVGGGGAWS